VNGLAHQVHGANCVLEPGVLCPGVDIMCKSQLFDPAEALKVAVLDQIKDQISRDRNKSVDRII
jgi:hypothetical protein